MNAIMSCTLKEAVRKKTFIIMGIITALYLVFWVILLYFFMREINQHNGGMSMYMDVVSYLLTIVGLNFSSMLVALLTIMLAAGAVSADLETGVIHAMLSRPLGRGEFILGKYLGFAVISCAYATALYAAILGLAAAFGLPTMKGLGFGALLAGYGYFILEPLVLLCLTVFGSVSIRTVPNGILMIFMYILGYIGGMVEQVGNIINNQNVIGSGIFLSLVSPFHSLYNSAVGVLLPNAGLMGDMASIMGGMAGGGSASSVWMYVYIAAYAAFFLGFAVKRFNKKDIT